LVSQAKICLNWHINNITAEWINNNYILLYTNIIYKKIMLYYSLIPLIRARPFWIPRYFKLKTISLMDLHSSQILSAISNYLLFFLKVQNGRVQQYINFFFSFWHFNCDSHYLQTMVRLLTPFTKVLQLLKSITLPTKRFYAIQLLTHYLHYLQFNAITGATYNNTIYITYSTKQYDYLFNLRYHFLHYLQNNIITDTTYIHVKAMSNKIKDTLILK